MIGTNIAIMQKRVVLCLNIGFSNRYGGLRNFLFVKRVDLIMSISKPTKIWSTKDIDKMLALLPIIEAKGLKAASWPKREPVEVNGELIQHVPYPEYHSVVDQFLGFCYKTSCFMEPYEVLPEDSTGTKPDTSTLHVLQNASDISHATVDQIRRYFNLCTRAERFCDGAIEGHIENGLIPAALRKLRRLRESM
jgi:hypothetical protein